MSDAVKRVSGWATFARTPLWRQDAHPATSWAGAPLRATGGIAPVATGDLADGLLQAVDRAHVHHPLHVLAGLEP